MGSASAVFSPSFPKTVGGAHKRRCKGLTLASTLPKERERASERGVISGSKRRTHPTCSNNLGEQPRPQTPRPPSTNKGLFADLSPAEGSKEERERESERERERDGGAPTH